MINLKNNIWIEGFKNSQEIINYLGFNRSLENQSIVIYVGKTFKVPEEIAKRYVNQDDKYFENYNPSLDEKEFNMMTAKESIITACDQDYCVIFKN